MPTKCAVTEYHICEIVAKCVVKYPMTRTWSTLVLCIDIIQYIDFIINYCDFNCHSIKLDL